MTDYDEVRVVIGHLEHPPEGYYEQVGCLILVQFNFKIVFQYKIRVDQYSIDDDDSPAEDGNVALTNGDTDFMNSKASKKRKRKRPSIYAGDGVEDENRMIVNSQQKRNRTRIKNTTERWFLNIFLFNFL